MPKTKIAHIITKLELGGAQKTTLSLLRHADKKRYEIHLITSPDGYLTQEARMIPGLKIFFVPSFTGRINIIKDLAAFFSITKYLKQQGISIAHTHSSKAGIIGRWAAWCAGIKKIFHTVHGWPFYIETHCIVRLFYRICEKLTSFITKTFIVVSCADFKTGLRFVSGKKGKYVNIPYGIESREFGMKNALLEKRDIIRVGFIACYKPQKAPLDFVKVVKLVVSKNNNIEFISAGDGILKPAAVDEASRLGLNEKIKFLGWQDDISGIMSTIDMLLLTSRWEGFPVVILEAFASGVPVVATDAGGISEIVTHGVNGFIEEKGACGKLANDILLLAENKAKMLQFSNQAKEGFKKEFDIHCMVSRIQDLYEQAERRLAI